MDETFLKLAIDQSLESVRQGGFPVGVVITIDNKVFETGKSNGKQLNDPTSHAEIAAIREACKKLKTRNLSNAILYSSMEPCLMCYGACFWAYIPKIVYACKSDKLSAMHFMGKHNLDYINNDSRRQISLIHLPKLEPEALSVINSWESSLK